MLKYMRTKSRSAIGIYHASFEAMWDNIPIEIKKALPSKMLAKLIDANWRLSSASKALATREIIENGFLWDAQRNKSINLEA